MTNGVMIGGTAEFDALVYGYEQHPGTQQYLQGHLQRVQERFQGYGEVINDAAQQYYQQARDMWERWNGAGAIATARAALQKAGAMFQPEAVRSIWDLGELQNASLTMQRIIMAQPDLRQLYHEQRADGFSETYIDMYPGAVGVDHYDYRRIVEGVLLDEPDDPENGWKAQFFFEEPVEGDRDLRADEKADALSTLDAIKLWIKGGFDPSDSYNGKL